MGLLADEVEAAPVRGVVECVPGIGVIKLVDASGHRESALQIERESAEK